MINKDLLKSGAPFLDDVALDRFDKYAELLTHWNEKINLTAITEPDEIVKKHFLDSLAFLNYVELPKGASIIDVGTGAGFPGLALLIARPDLKVTLLDSTQKKLMVIEEISKAIDLNPTLLHMRAEDGGHDKDLRESFDFATARAVSNLRDLSEYCIPFVKVGGSFISMKGAEAEKELEEARNAIKILGANVKSFDKYQLDGCGERAIINIEKISSTDNKYPRPKGKMVKQPL